VSFTTTDPNTRVRVSATVAVEASGSGFDLLLVAVDEAANPLFWAPQAVPNAGDLGSVSFTFTTVFAVAGAHTVTLWAGGTNGAAFLFISPDPTNFRTSAVLLVEEEA
jgi:hypothetical protein